MVHFVLKTSLGREGESREKRGVDRVRWIEDVGLVSRDEAVELGKPVWY